VLLGHPAPLPRRVAGGDIGRVQAPLPGLAHHLVEADDLALVMAQHLLDPAAGGALLGPHGGRPRARRPPPPGLRRGAVPGAPPAAGQAAATPPPTAPSKSGRGGTPPRR